MPNAIDVTVNGRSIRVAPGTSAAAAIALAGNGACRTSISGELRGPLCGMGICFECRVTIGGRPHQRSCQIPCAEGMEVRTDE